MEREKARARPAKRPIHPIKLVVFTLLTTLLFLACLELVLSAFPSLILRWRSGEGQSFAKGETAIIALGDSVTFGFGLRKEQNYPSQLGVLLEQRGHPGVHIVIEARPGARAPLIAEQLEVFKRLPPNIRKICLLMVGHNDFASYQDQILSGGGLGRRVDFPSLERSEASRVPSRLERIINWGLLSLEFGQAAWRLDGESRSRYKESLGQVMKEVKAANSHLFFLTYLVPGKAPSALDAKRAQVLETTRRYQKEVNRLIRSAGKEYDVPVIDLEFLAPVPTTWSRSDFIDQIHPTEKTYGLIAEAVYDFLLARGELPALPRGESLEPALKR